MTNILNSERLKVFLVRLGTRQGCLPSPLLINVVLEFLAMVIIEDKEIKGIQVGKEVKVSLFSDDMILHIENPKDVTRKLLALINKFGKVSGYKINTQKSIAFLYIKDEKLEREVKETIPPAITSKRIKYLEINLSNVTKDLYSKHYMMQLKEIKGDKDRWREISCSCIGRINVVKMTTLSKAIYRFNSMLFKLSCVFFKEVEGKKKFLKCVWKQKRP